MQLNQADNNTLKDYIYYMYNCMCHETKPFEFHNWYDNNKTIYPMNDPNPHITYQYTRTQLEDYANYVIICLQENRTIKSIHDWIVIP